MRTAKKALRPTESKLGKALGKALEGSMPRFLRTPHLVLAAAFMFSVIGAVDTSFADGFADGNFTSIVSVPDSTTATTDAPGGVGDGISVNLDGIASVDAQSIALVSAAARQVEIAKAPEGARAVAAQLIADSYPDWTAVQVRCLNSLWNGESHWNFQAHNYRSGAQGIAQALPPTKMEIVSTDWRTNPVTQIKWGLSYIKARYKTPCKALSHKHWAGYY